MDAAVAAEPPALDDAAMEDLFREILASPSLCAAPLGAADAPAAASASLSASDEGAAGGVGLGLGDKALDGTQGGAHAGEEEMQALWEWLPAAADVDGGADAQGALDVLSAIELGIGSSAGVWADLVPPPTLASVPEVF